MEKLADLADRVVRAGQRLREITDEWPRAVSRRQQRLHLGRELVDSTPMAPPIGYVKTPSLAEKMREMIRSEQLRLAALSQGFETFEEADDFDVPDDPPDPSTPYEELFEPPVEYVPEQPPTAAPGAHSVKGSGAEGDAPLDSHNPTPESGMAGAGRAGDGIGEPLPSPGETMISGWFRPRPAPPSVEPRPSPPRRGPTK